MLNGLALSMNCRNADSLLPKDNLSLASDALSIPLKIDSMSQYLFNFRSKMNGKVRRFSLCRAWTTF